MRNQNLNSYPIKLFFFIGVFLLAGIVFVWTPGEDVAPFIILLFGIVIALFVTIMVEPHDFKTVFSLFLIAFAIRVFLSTLLFLLSYSYGSSGVEGYLLDNDGVGYDLNGWYIAQRYNAGLEIDPLFYLIEGNLGWTLTPYHFWVARVYQVIGRSPLSLFFINSFASALVIIFIYSMAKQLLDKKAAILCAAFAGFFPSLILWSAQNLKDPIINLMLCLVFFLWLRIIRKFKIFYLLLSIFPLYVLYKLSPLFIPCLVLTFFFSLITILYGARKKKIQFLFMAIGLTAASITVIYFSNLLEPLVIKLTGETTILKFIAEGRRLKAYGNLAIMPGFSMSNPMDALLFLPIALTYAWFSPFPWQIGSVAQITALPEMLLFYLLVPPFLKGISYCWKNKFRETFPLIFFMVFIMLMLGYVEGNSGTLFRHKSPILCLIFIFISIGIFKKPENYHKNLPV
ncbi:MAG: glycosyltransferase family 39 protein [Desulfobacterales bacterium]|nr:glycosyltransferase family 39 protein [Desulfobacterales bacterium]